MLLMFSYGRQSGTREHAELAPTHRLIGERVVGTTIRKATNGPHTLVVKAYDAAGASATSRVNVRVQLSRPGDFVAGNKAEPVVFGRTTGTWALLNPEIGPPMVFSWGLRGDIPLAGDYVGDSKLDATVFRPSTGTWFFFDLGTGRTGFQQWGAPGDVPVRGDFLGDARADLAVFRPSEGNWYLRNPATGEIKIYGWGRPGDIPVAGDFIRDPRYTGVELDRTDLTVFRPSEGTWYIRDLATGQVSVHPFGSGGDVPVA